MSPSSTSNSDARLDVRAGLLAAALLLLVELGVVRSGFLWKRAPNTMVGAFYAIETHVLASAPPPQIVFMGSSRMRDAVAPRALESVMGLPRGAVLNLGLTGGTPYEARLFYERHRPLLKQARIIVIGVEDWYWNDGYPRSDVERHFATFADRHEWFRERHELGDLVGGVWRTVELQDPLTRFGMSFFKGVKTIKFDEDRVAWRPPTEVLDLGPTKTDIVGPVEHNMQNFKTGTPHEASLRSLVGDAKRDGARVVLTQLPLRAAYVDELERRYPSMVPYLRDRVSALAAELDAEATLYFRGTEVGIEDDRFYDYGHFAEDGVRRMNAVWKDRLR